MCGIAGSVDLSFASRPDPETLARMAAALEHRGPDGAGVFLAGPCGLAHARLSIVDLAGGAQPMSTSDERLTVVFNGEIFNHVELRAELASRGRSFRSSSDTEVLLHAYAEWGDACVLRFNGDFAFALWDLRRRRLFCARDRAGVRPFFHTRAAVDGAARRFLFASEVKALFAAGAPAALDARGLHEALTFWSARAPRTVWRGVDELPPAHTLVVDEGGVHARRYWAPSYDARDAGDAGDDRLCARAAGELLDLLDDATRIRLRADVPVGAYLSGGLDSSLVSALARRHAPALSTFSVAFEEAAYDESAFQESMAEHLGTQHRVVRVSNADVGAAFVDVVRHAEAPIVRTAPAPLMRLAGLVRASGMKVVLTGEGSDELFGGYDIFKEAKVRRFCARRPSSRLRPLLLRRLYPWLPALQQQPHAFLRAFFHAGPADLDDPLFSHLPRFKMADGLRGLLSDDVAAAVADHNPLQELRDSLPAAFRAWDPLSQAQFLETTILLPGYLLAAQGDRMAMAQSVEGRFPFLDPRVIDFAARLPARAKLRGLDEKHVLKRAAAAALVPAQVLARKKQPYRAPEAQAFFTADGARHAFVEEALAPESIRAGGIFDDTAVGKLVARVQRDGTARARDGMALVFVISTQLCVQHLIKSSQHQAPSIEVHDNQGDSHHVHG